MRIRLAVVLLGVVVPLQTSQAGSAALVDAIAAEGLKSVARDIDGLCADQWPSDFVMRKHCRAESSRSYAKAQSFDAMATNENAVIWSTCATLWTDAKQRTDWFMMAHCLDEQSAALNNP